VSATGGVVGGVLALTFLQATLAGSESRGGGVVAGAFTLTAKVLQHVLDPAVPLIPDLRNRPAQTRPAGYITAAPPATGTAAPPATAPTLIPA
jgi:hypothetical protein